MFKRFFILSIFSILLLSLISCSKLTANSTNELNIIEPTKLKTTEVEVVEQKFDKTKLIYYFNEQQINFPIKGQDILNLGYECDKVLDADIVISVVIKTKSTEHFSLVTGVKNTSTKENAYKDVDINMIQVYRPKTESSAPPVKINYDNQIITFESSIDDILNILGPTTFSPSTIANETTRDWYDDNVKLTIRDIDGIITDITIHYN